MTSLSPRVLNEILAAVRELPPALLDRVARELDKRPQLESREQLVGLGANPNAKKRLGALADAILAHSGQSGLILAAAVRAMAYTLEKNAADQSLEIAWTGPGTAAIPVRRVDQLMYELLEGAESEIVLVSYVTFGADSALKALRAATARGVRVTLIVERADETDGKLHFDGIARVRENVPEVSIFFWPQEKRVASKEGKQGILHAKCLICDQSRALVSSANLTDHGLELNMELGLVVNGGEVPRRLAAHFNQLIVQGELKRWN